MASTTPAHPAARPAPVPPGTAAGRPAPGGRSTSAPGSTSRRPAARPGVVLAVILAAQLMIVLDATIVNVALPDIQRSLGFSTASLSWVLNAYTLVLGGLLLLGARAGDLLGRRRTFLAGIGLFTLASLAGGVATGSGTLLAARAVQGAGAALAAPSTLALLTTMFAEGRERLRAIGLFTAVSLSGGAVGLVAGGLLTQWASWRWVMFVNVPIGVVVLAVARRALAETPRAADRHVDVLGALTSTLGVGALVLGFVQAAADGWGSATAIGSFVAAALLLPAFVLVERRHPDPVTPLRLLTDPSRSAANVARALLFAGMYGVFFFLTQFLQDVLGYGALATGFAFLPMPAMVFTVSRLVGRLLAHRVSGTVLALAGGAFALAGYLAAMQLHPGASYGHVLLVLMLLGTGNGLAFVPLTTAAIARVPAADAGAASGLVNVAQQLGGTLGVAVLVTVAEAAARSHGGTAPQAFTAGVDAAFRTCLLFVAAALALVALLVRAPRVARA